MSDAQRPRIRACRWRSTRWGATRHPARSSPVRSKPTTAFGLPVVLVGPRDQMGDTGDLPVIEASEVIAMDEEPGNAVRRKKDSSLVRAAEAVRDGRACAMVSAGNTGAAMASALLRMGRLKGIARPGIATPDPPGRERTRAFSSTPAPTPSAPPRCSCSSPRWAPPTRRPRYHSEAPTVGLLSIGEEPTKGSPLVKEAHALLAELPGINFVGNVEGRDLLPGDRGRGRRPTASPETSP